jgi:hypothetical protein
VPEGKVDDVVIVNPDPMWMLKDWAAERGGVEESVTCTVTVKSPGVVGTPCQVPSVYRESPGTAQLVQFQW